MTDDTTDFDKHRARFAARRAAAPTQPAAGADTHTSTGAVAPGTDALIPLTGDQVRILESSIISAITAHLQQIPNFQPQAGPEYILDQSYLLHASRRRDNDPAVNQGFVKADLLSHLYDLMMEEVHYGSRKLSKTDVMRYMQDAQQQVEYGFGSVGGMEKILPGGTQEFERVVAETTDEVRALCQAATARQTGRHER